MRVLIIGCGYVGTALGLRLIKAGHEVFGARRSVEGAAALSAQGIKPILLDISSSELWPELPVRCEWVVNTVSAGGGGAAGYRQTYLEGNRRLIKALSANPPDRFVYTSSTGVYGQDDGSWVDETCPTAPGTETGEALVQAEQCLLDAARQGFPTTVLRVAGIYGPGRGYWLRQFLAGAAVMDGAGDRWLNMVHREDVAGAIETALERGLPGSVYNVVDDEPVRQRDMFAWLAETLERPMPPSQPEDRSGRARTVTNKRISNAKMKAELQWRLKFPSFREGYASLAREGAASGAK